MQKLAYLSVYIYIMYTTAKIDWLPYLTHSHVGFIHFYNIERNSQHMMF